MPAAAVKPTDLAELRRSMRRARARLSPATQCDHALAVARRVIANGVLLAGRTFAAYDAINGELDAGPLIDRLLAAHRPVALPVIRAGGVMDFYRITPRTPFRTNRHGILEPDTLSACFQPPHAIDVVFTPLVAFDARGHRLGMGGGYYDRFLGRTRGHAPLIVGLAHALQEAKALPRAAWDIPLDLVVTERSLTAFSARGRRFTNSRGR